MENEKGHRIDGIDSLKGLGIILVVTGHFIEPYRSEYPLINSIYICIYAFHMPLFCLLSGMVSVFNVKKTLLKMAWIYLLAQLFYLPFGFYSYGMANGGVEMVKRIFLPYWHMWYLYALIIWQLSLSVVEVVCKYVPKVFFLLGYIVIALMSGKVDYWPLDLTRVMVFYTFFITGYLYKNELLIFFQKRRDTKIIIAYFFILFILCTGVAIKAGSINAHVMWEYQSYIKGDYTMLERLAFLAGAFLFCIPLAASCAWCKNRFLICLGKKTLPIYIFHAAFLKVFNVLIKNINFRYDWIRLICVVIAITGVISFLQSDLIQKCINKIGNLLIGKYLTSGYN
ncbi:MAG: acyltransferase family protein [Butyrivibrio sp.]|nr:acyltransferase family protein [Butyrivibrio sp.]